MKSMMKKMILVMMPVDTPVMDVATMTMMAVMMTTTATMTMLMMTMMIMMMTTTMITMLIWMSPSRRHDNNGSL